MKDDFFDKKRIITCGFVSLSVFYLLDKCGVALGRFFAACGDVYSSIIFWFNTMLARARHQELPSKVGVTVDDIPDVDIQQFLPFDLEELYYRFETLPQQIIDSDNFYDFNLFFVLFFFKTVLLSLIVITAWLMVVYVFGDMLFDENEKPSGHISRSYHGTLRFYYKYCKPFVTAVKNYFDFLRREWWYLVILGIIWGLCFNVFTIAFELIAYYFFMITGFDLEIFGGQLVKLLIDLVIMFATVPWYLWVIIVFTFYAVFAFIKGYDRLRHGEAKNCGIAKELNYCIMFAGPMGLGKTAIATDISLSYNNIFKADANDSLYKYDMMFPLFPWELYEAELRERIESRQIYNLPCVDLYVNELKKVYERTPSPCVLFNYNVDTCPMERDIGTHTVSIFDAMKEYGRAYFAYMNDNPAVANYSIRLDGYHDDSPYFKKWCGDFFQTDPSKSRYAHILDQDSMRLGKRILPDNPYSGSFGFGIYNNTEWGKSRLNQVGLEGVKKDAPETNQKNDLYDYLIKLVRHASVMIDNKVFFRFIADEQRPESIPASLRDVVTVIQIVDKSELKLALPGAKVIDLIYDFVYSKFKDYYYNYRNKRGDRTVPTLLIKGFLSAASNFFAKLYNIFGYFDVQLSAESGTAYGNQGDSVSGAKMYTYQLAVKKIYSKRYSTDCYQQFFEKKQLECAFGINDLPTYSSLKMTVEEMEQQHDYFLMEIMGIMLGEVAPEECTSVPIKNKRKKETPREPQIEVQEFTSL